VRIMVYDPRRPHAERYVKDPKPAEKKLLGRVERDALKLCQALGYDLNTVEFAVGNGVPYAIDFMNPAPDADLHSVGKENFEWIVEAVADLAVKKAKAAKPKVPEFHWSAYLGAASDTAKAAATAKPAKSAGKAVASKPAAKKASAKKAVKSAKGGQPEATVSAIE